VEEREKRLNMFLIRIWFLVTPCDREKNIFLEEKKNNT